ncbi:MAG: type II toxin-antitoxin system VapC family toxin [Acidobacteria bacterium]|nr:type II toxin-antitoxin system VapC family toxin [Acidobacteriota bacterium]
MNLLLDTHLLLWWLGGSKRMGPQARELISDPGNTIFVSSVSLWEIWLKVSLGKLRISPSFDAALANEGFEVLPLTASHARRVSELPWLHRDPFDRMLVAQAAQERVTLLSTDDVLAGYGKMVRVV